MATVTFGAPSAPPQTQGKPSPCPRASANPQNYVSLTSWKYGPSPGLKTVLSLLTVAVIKMGKGKRIIIQMNLRRKNELATVAFFFFLCMGMYFIFQFFYKASLCVLQQEGKLSLLLLMQNQGSFIIRLWTRRKYVYDWWNAHTLFRNPEASRTQVMSMQ